MAIFNSKLLVYQRVSGDNLGQRLRNRVSGCIRYSIKRDYSQVIVALDKVPISSQRFNGFPLHLASSSLMWVVCVSSLNTKKTCFPLKAISCFSLSDLSSLHYSGFHSKLDQVSKEIPPPIQNNSKDLFLHQFPTPKNTKKTNNDSKESSVPRCLVVPRSRLVAPRRSRRHRSTGVTRFAPWPPQPPSKGRSNARRKHQRRRGRATRRSWRLMTVTRCASFCLDFNGLQKLATSWWFLMGFHSEILGKSRHFMEIPMEIPGSARGHRPWGLRRLGGGFDQLWGFPWGYPRWMVDFRENPSINGDL
jgi:hypothetical protein